MKPLILTPAIITAHAAHLARAERAPATIQSYTRALTRFLAWQGSAPIDKAALVRYKAHLAASGQRPASVNVQLAALNSLFTHLRRTDLHLQYLRLQRRLFRDPARELSQRDYQRLHAAARRESAETALLLETLAATGIRASELRHITVQAAREGRAEIHLKGKIRTILLVPALCKKLRAFAKRKKIAHGALFRTTDDRPYSRYQLWAMLKRLARKAHVDPRRVFPHNLRRLFAVTYYEKTRDIVRLADILGHSSVETTRLYLTTSGREHTRQLESLRLVQ